MATPVLLTYSEVAAVLKCQVRHVRALVAEGRLPYVQIGKRARRISSPALDAFLTDSTKFSRQPAAHAHAMRALLSPASATAPSQRPREVVLDINAWRRPQNPRQGKSKSTG